MSVVEKWADGHSICDKECKELKGIESPGGSDKACHSSVRVTYGEAIFA